MQQPAHFDRDRRVHFIAKGFINKDQIGNIYHQKDESIQGHRYGRHTGVGDPAGEKWYPRYDEQMPEVGPDKSPGRLFGVFEYIMVIDPNYSYKEIAYTITDPCWP